MLINCGQKIKGKNFEVKGETNCIASEDCFEQRLEEMASVHSSVMSHGHTLILQQKHYYFRICSRCIWFARER
ncbi:uncharacterized protein MONOS_120 [Monocercomonoides exilis]|uniref:uncharacterized protein n=1 Tax=Monocercomonoides exilis TaxID=2049356 RepID=UPI00355A91E3|nr:hypothetical protein MONOS_120 [Monocercomonoides exilis]|eukprot:MONOS_120.1-p1 / transcript=MONOS_120.1 / gene=MONOS_120 / organism=Monocercomonoides_exilis_PA203 / gene_product=unspecified product / transcript_product=unspecified product / location=Mono_scaffold00002:204337-204948(+) / protein_length=73 / sequence_SO=supercontig / SO=protein_coding / is_pseudo=false